MLSSIGSLLLFLNLCLTFLVVYFSYENLKKGHHFLIDKKIYQLSLLQCTFIIICFLTLISAFVISDGD